jgi:hypothetical protein
LFTVVPVVMKMAVLSFPFATTDLRSLTIR